MTDSIGKAADETRTTENVGVEMFVNVEIIIPREPPRELCFIIVF